MRCVIIGVGHFGSVLHLKIKTEGVPLITRKVMFSCLIFILLVMIIQNSVAQNIEAVRIDNPPKINGLLDDAAWQNSNRLTEFTQFEPVYNAAATMETIVRIVYDGEKIYFGIDCRDPEPDKITAKITKRDGEISDDDWVGILLDTFDDDNSGYLLLVNPLGTQKDARVADNGRTTDFSWDESWESASAITAQGWSVEVAVPFRALKYDANKTTWGFFAGRQIARLLEQHFTVPDLISNTRVSQAAALTNLRLEDLSIKKYTIIPYVQAQFQEGEKTETQAGLDLRYNVTSNLGIEATINPDFATIEGDVEQVNLTRFELSYPEKRPFFLEGAENYSTRIKQFYSRRIGEIPWGAKLSGKIGNWKINGLTTQSDPSTAGLFVEPGKDALYSVFRINGELKRGSTIGLIGANRYYDDQHSGSVGLAGTLFFTDVLGMTTQLVKTYGEADEGTWTYFLRPSYDSQFAHFHVRYSHTGEGVRENMNGIGFIRDDDRREFDTNIRRTFWINKYGIEWIRPSINYNQYWSQEGVLKSWDDSNQLEMKFLKKWEWELEWEEEFKRFEKDFRNRMISNQLSYDSKQGLSISFEYGKGINYEHDVEKISGGVDVKVMEGWNLEYQFTKYWFRPAIEEDNSWIHFVRTSYYLNKDLFFKVFYQTKYEYYGKFLNPELDLLRKTIQVVFVWRFLPPFGALQLAYQEGTTRHTEAVDRGRSFFAKLSWVF